MVLVLVLEMLQGVPRLPQDLVLPDLQLGAEVLALPLVHERLFVGRPVAVEAIMGLLGQVMTVLLGHALLLFLLPQHSPQLRAPRCPRAAGLDRKSTRL